MNDSKDSPDSKRSASNILLLVMLCLTITSIGALVFVVRQLRPLVAVYQRPTFDCASFVKSLAGTLKLTVPAFGGHGNASGGGIQRGQSHHVWTGTLAGSRADLVAFEAANKKAPEDEFRRRGSTVINKGSGSGEYTFQVRTGITETYFEVFLSEIFDDPGSKHVTPHHRRQIFVAIHEY